MIHDSISSVLRELDEIVDWAVTSQHRAGYFAALYREVTQRIKDEVEAGRFEDGQRMERLDVIFASRYFDALRAYREGGEPTQSWRVAFERSQQWRPVILQHLVLGMSAHINLDLGIAAAETAPGSELPSLRRDFDTVSDILAEMLDDVQARLGRLSPWLGILDYVGGRTDEEVFSFSLRRSRDFAWVFAERLASLSGDGREAEIRAMDRIVADLARAVRRSGFLLKPALLVVRLREPNNAADVIRGLSG